MRFDQQGTEASGEPVDFKASSYRAGGRIMLLLYVAWVATWQSMYDPRLWTEAASFPSKAAPRVNITRS